MKIIYFPIERRLKGKKQKKQSIEKTNYIALAYKELKEYRVYSSIDC